MVPKGQRNYYDVVVVGSGPAGAICAGILARDGYKVALCDRFAFPRDKACGDVIGPRALALLQANNLPAPRGIVVGDMDIFFPNGSRMTLPSEPGIDEGGVGVSMRRRDFDALYHDFALRHGAKEIVGRVSVVTEQPNGDYQVTVSTRPLRRVTCRVLVGADGANSTVARQLGLHSSQEMLQAFALRRYVQGELDRPLISLLAQDNKLFPGYGWAFPSPGNTINIGIGVKVSPSRRGSALATSTLGPYLSTLIDSGKLRGVDSDHIDSRGTDNLGGWLSMGMSGVLPGRRRALLIGDAAGLVNPLQGEGIAQAIDSAISCANAIRSSVEDPSVRYRLSLTAMHRRYQQGSALLQTLAIRYPSVSLRLANAIGHSALSNTLAPTWGIYWNDLSRSVGPINGGASARLVEQLAYRASQVSKIKIATSKTKGVRLP